jgi:hypothetical protein
MRKKSVVIIPNKQHSSRCHRKYYFTFPKRLIPPANEITNCFCWYQCPGSTTDEAPEGIREAK